MFVSSKHENGISIRTHTGATTEQNESFNNFFFFLRNLVTSLSNISPNFRILCFLIGTLDKYTEVMSEVSKKRELHIF